MFPAFAFFKNAHTIQIACRISWNVYFFSPHILPSQATHIFFFHLSWKMYHKIWEGVKYNSWVWLHRWFWKSELSDFFLFLSWQSLVVVIRAILTMDAASLIVLHPVQSPKSIFLLFPLILPWMINYNNMYIFIAWPRDSSSLHLMGFMIYSFILMLSSSQSKKILAFCKKSTFQTASFKNSSLCYCLPVHCFCW